MAKRLLYHLNSSMHLMRKRDSYRELLSSVLNRCLSECPRVEKEKKVGTVDLGEEDWPPLPMKTKRNEPGSYNPKHTKHNSDDGLISWKWKSELAWLSKALEPALQLYKWALTGSDGAKTPPSTRSLAEILTDLQVSKVGIQDWSLSDLTVGLYLIYLSQASSKKVEDFTGVQIFSDIIVIS